MKKNKKIYIMPLHASLEVEGKDAAAFEEWVKNLPLGSHGPAISEWIYQVELTKGVKAKLSILIPSWDEYRAVKKR